MKRWLLFSCIGLVLVTNVNAKAYPPDIAGTFINYENGNPASCPTAITQTTFTDGPVSYSWQFEHNTVLHGESRCNSDGKHMTVYYNDSLVPDNVPEGLNRMLNKHGINLEIDYPLNHRSITAGETYYIGYESKGRYCQDGSKFDGGTVYFLFRPFLPVYMPVGTEFYSFEPEWKYLIVVPQFSDELCVYRAFVPGAASDPALQKIALQEPEDDGNEVAEETAEIEPEALEYAEADEEISESVEVSPQIDAETETEAEMTTESDETEIEPTELVEAPAEEVDVMEVRPLLEGLIEPTIEPVVENACFPGDQLVELESGKKKMMKDLVIGDRVLSGTGSYSDVFMFSHKIESISTWFVQLTTEDAELKLSGGHYLEINGHLGMAGSAKAGDVIILSDGRETEIKAVHYVKSNGLYNPQTTDGTIVVNGIIVSCYTKTVEPNAAQALLSPLRTIFWMLGMSTQTLERGLV